MFSTGCCYYICGEDSFTYKQPPHSGYSFVSLNIKYLELYKFMGLIQNILQGPTNPFTILKPQNQEIGDWYVVKYSSSSSEAPKLWKSSSGA